jgi:Predicted signal transduction protein with a C-terminal ATPase domain
MFSIFNKKSFNSRLLLAFILTSIIPIILVNVFSYVNSSNIVTENNNERTLTNLQQTRTSVDTQLESYEDILYQVYTNDQVMTLVNKINSEEDPTIEKRQLRETLSSFIFTKQYLQAIIIITDNGNMIYYDQLTGSSTKNPWIDNIGMSTKDLYESIYSQNANNIISTKFAFNFVNKPIYLFYEGHRLINYPALDKRNGIALLCIDESMLRNICFPAVKDQTSKLTNFDFIVDRDGYIVTYVDPAQISKKIFSANMTDEQKKQALTNFVKENYLQNDGNISINTIYDDKYNWYIVNATDQGKALEKLGDQQRITIFTIILSSLALAFIIVFLTKRLTRSINKVVSVMGQAGEGELFARVDLDKNMPSEIEMIATDFNKMLEKLEKSIENEKEANAKEKNAEIKALEAQINPHFLYNTLDTINWMAIDNNQFEISNAINSLAYILRYGIDKSNAIVTVGEEVEWLKKYIFLQQTRLKNTFKCSIKAPRNIYEFKIHKLLFQPFVENAILHGFEGVERTYRLGIGIYSKNGYLMIEIHDNGKGIKPELIEQINNGIFAYTVDKNHIGLQNAITRIQMYYGENAKVRISSVLGKGTTVEIYIPFEEKKGE